MGSTPKSQAPSESPESRLLTQLDVERAKFIQPYEQDLFSRTLPLQTGLTEQQLKSQLSLQPQTDALARTQLGLTQGLAEGNISGPYSKLLSDLTPITLTGSPYDQAYESARNRLESNLSRSNADILSNQNAAGVLESGATHELLRRNREQADLSLGDLATVQAQDEVNRLNQEKVLQREAEGDLNSRLSNLLGFSLGGTPSSGSNVSSGASSLSISPFSGAQSALEASRAGILSREQMRQQAIANAQNAALAARGQNLGFLSNLVRFAF